MHKILITGGAGFVGSNLSILFKHTYPSYQIIALDNLKRRGSELNLARLQQAGVEFIHADIRNREDLETIAEASCIIDASADPSVLSGIHNPVLPLVNTNLVGTINCLQLASKLNAGFIFLSTSRVYPIKAINALHFIENDTRFILAEKQERGASAEGLSEDFTLQGSRSFYGATKLASELLIEEYHTLLGLQTVVNRCGIITGPWQMGKIDQGVIVLWLARHFWKGQLAYNGYGGEGKQVRDILHVEDLFRLLDYQVHHLRELSGQTFNVGGGRINSVSLQELSGLCRQATGNQISITPLREDRVADIRIYITDNTKITNLTGWKPRFSVQNIVEDILKWMEKNADVLKPILN